jgi:hypothetical protein
VARRPYTTLAGIVILALLMVFPLVAPRAGAATPTSIVYLESGPDDERTRLVIEPLQIPDGEDPADTRVVFQIAHERGFMPRGTLSPDGGKVALVRQPRGVPDREGAEALLVDLEDQPGQVTILPVPAFGLSTPIFAPSGNEWLYVTSATRAPAPSEAEMKAGRLVEYDFTIRQVYLSNLAVVTRYEQRLTYLHPIDVGLVLFAGHSRLHGLLVYRVTHGGADVAALNIYTRDAPTSLTNLGFAMARDFDLTDDRAALIFSASDPGQKLARIQALYLTLGGGAAQLGGSVPREATPAWAGTSHRWYFSRPLEGHEEEALPELHQATDLAQDGLPLDSLAAMTGMAPAPEVLVEGGVSPGGRFVAVRANTEEGMVTLLRDTESTPQSARVLGDGGVIRVLGFK